MENIKFISRIVEEVPRNYKIVRNKFTEKTYEAIQYFFENYQECKSFILDNMDISISSVVPNMMVYCLMSYNKITEIKPTDYIIRTITNGMPLYSVVSQEIMESNFDEIDVKAEF